MRQRPVFDGELRPGTRAFTGEPLARTRGADFERHVPMLRALPSLSSRFRRGVPRPGFTRQPERSRVRFG